MIIVTHQCNTSISTDFFLFFLYWDEEFSKHRFNCTKRNSRYNHNGDKIVERLRKTAGYFLFIASIALWYCGVGRFINEIFQKEMIPFIGSEY